MQVSLSAPSNCYLVLLRGPEAFPDGNLGLVEAVPVLEYRRSSDDSFLKLFLKRKVVLQYGTGYDNTFFGILTILSTVGFQLGQCLRPFVPNC